jgi:hypothetical protein
VGRLHNRGMAQTDPGPNLKRLRLDSDALMEKLAEMRRAEDRKRQADVSTPEFHQLSDRVDQLSNQVFRLAQGEEDVAERTPTTETSIDEIDPRQDA